MKAITSIFRRFRKTAGIGSPRKRPARAFASPFATIELEGRAMLSVVGPVSVTTSLSATTLTLIESTPLSTASANPGGSADPGNPGGQVDSQGSGGSEGSGESASNHGSPSGPTGSDVDKNAGHSLAPGDPMAMDDAKLTVDGQPTREFALANFDASEVFVWLGPDRSSEVILGPSQGVDHPASVTLADLNNDGIPDLIVANTNGNNILVFPGLANGQFGPEEEGGSGFAVGSDPVSVTANYVDDDPDKAQLIVANAESNSVTVLGGQAIDGAWVVTSTSTIATPSLPVKTIVYDVDDDGNPDLLVCDSGADEVTMYAGQADGSFNPNSPTVFGTDIDPVAIFVGPFDRRDQTDLVAVNAGSNDLTFIGDAFGPKPTTQTISSGGTSPDAAFAIDPTHTGTLDLVVANGGDGHLAVFRAGNDTMQLAGVITQANVPAPSALAPASTGGDGFDFFAASAGEDAALLLHFDLGTASAYLPGDPSGSAIGQGDGELVGELTSLDDASLSLIAVYWAGSGESEAISGGSDLREPSTITALYSPTEGQGGDQPNLLPEGSSGRSDPPEKPVDPSKIAASPLAEYITGIYEALKQPRKFVAALADRDATEELDDRPMDGLARLDPDLDRRSVDPDPDVEPASGFLDGIIRLHPPDEATGEGLAPIESPPMLETVPEVDGDEGRIGTVPLVSTALLLSTRLILNAATPRPTGFRGKGRPRRFVSLEHNRQDGNRPDPL